MEVNKKELGFTPVKTSSANADSGVSSSGGGATPPPPAKKCALPGMPDVDALEEEETVANPEFDLADEEQDPDAEVIALSPKTLLATNRFVCEVCGKGFQREQNLQLHRRGHNLPRKLKQRSRKEVRKRVYVCPEPSCVHHHPSRALGDLTGIKKHFCRKHGEKKWKCDKCSKRYAVQSDWKAHNRNCGTRDREYRCDCGTLFSRRDSFITHRAFCDALAEESTKARAAPLPQAPIPATPAPLQQLQSPPAPAPETQQEEQEESMEAPISALGGAVFKLPVKLDGLLRHGYMLPKGAEDEILLIKRDLEEIIAILQNHISRLDYPSVMVNCWMKEVRELSYDIDDCIDQYEHAAGSKSKYVCKIPRRKLTLRKTNRLSEKLKQRLWMANKIREFSARVQEALQRHELYNLGGIGRTPPPPPPPTIYDVPFRSPHHVVYGEAVDLVGIDAPMNKLEELLIKDGEQKLKVVSIVGVAGIGKTTLANKIYCKLGGQFDCRAFVRASQKPDMRRLLTSMLSQVRPHQPPDTWKVHNLITAIRTHLKDKRYLIVADDVWATSTWDTLNCALPDDNCCSRILITTEIEDVAHKCYGYESKYVFRMKPLGDGDSRKLFFNSVFGPQYECPPELREVSNNIIRKCGGVPLATVTVACLLASQKVKLEQWDYVNKSLGYGLRTNTTLEGMTQVLNLSYDSLPSHLKACILYLSIYEEDYIIWKDDLVKQWIAEGFLCSTEEQDKEEIFGRYFDELVSRRMIQPVRINENNEVLSCVVHHMVLKLIAYKSIEENFVIAIDHSQTTTRFADKVRRLSLHSGNTEDAMPPTNMRLSQVRTLAFFGVFKCLPSIAEYGLLQVLILHIWGDEDSISFDITRISKLFRLRYLQVTSNVTLELRTQMLGLQCLETLKIDARASTVPSDIVHLPSLLHLNLPAKTNLPNGIDHMTQLRTLGYFDLSGNSIENVQSLSELTNLQDLQLTCYAVQPDNLKSNMQCLGSILGKLINLKSLTLVPAGGSSYVNILDVSGATSRSISGDDLGSVSSPPALIQRIVLSLRVCIFYTVPTWIGHLGKLCVLKIGVRELARSDVDVLRGLPALTVLSLYVHTMPVERVVFDKAGFSVLKYFKFRCSVAWLKFEAGAMPNLRKLKLGFNAHGADRYGTTMPVGIEHLSGLTDISAKIGNTGAKEPNKRSAESVLSETIKMHPGHPNVNIQCVDWMFGCVTASTFVSLDLIQEATSLDLIQEATSQKRRKSMRVSSSKRVTQMRVSSAHDGSVPDDGFCWRKYGQKDVLGAKHSRCYYRCKDKNYYGCPAKKKVQRTDSDPLLFDVVYSEHHTCTQSAHSDNQRPRPAASAGAEHSQSSTTESLQSQVTDATVSGSMAGAQGVPMGDVAGPGRRSGSVPKPSVRHAADEMALIEPYDLIHGDPIDE